MRLKCIAFNKTYILDDMENNKKKTWFISKLSM